MGLDMFAFVTDGDIPQTDFDLPEDGNKIHYWRKHPNLHGWMKQLYQIKGGADPEFNCNTLRLDGPDLELLEQAILDDDLPFTAGFFFGQSDGSEHSDDRDFLHKARAEIAKGRRITAEHRDAFQALTSGDYSNFALFSCFVGGEPAAAIVAVNRDGDDYTIVPLFVAITPVMVLTDHDGDPCAPLEQVRSP